MNQLLPGVWAITAAGTPPRPLRAHETVTDVEELCRGVIARAVRELAAPLQPDDVVLSLEQLFERCVVVSRSYAPRSAGIEFRPWLFQELYWDLIDFWRSWLGRHGTKRVLDERLFEPEDAGRDAWKIDPVDAVEDDRDRFGDRLEQALAEGAVDSEEARSDAFVRFLAQPDRPVLRQVRGLGDDPGEAAEVRARAAAAMNGRAA